MTYPITWQKVRTRSCAVIAHLMKLNVIYRQVGSCAPRTEMEKSIFCFFKKQYINLTSYHIFLILSRLVRITENHGALAIEGAQCSCHVRICSKRPNALIVLISQAESKWLGQRVMWRDTWSTGDVTWHSKISYWCRAKMWCTTCMFVLILLLLGSVWARLSLFF